MKQFGALLLLGGLSALSVEASTMPHPTSKGFVEYFFSGVRAQQDVARFADKKKSSIRESEVRQLLTKKMRSLKKSQVIEMSRLIMKLAKQFDMHPGLILSVINVESGFKTRAVSPKGALGLMQIMPDTGYWLCRQYRLPWKGPDMLFEPLTNVTLGVFYLDMLRKAFDGDPVKILAAYNWGPGNVQKNITHGRVLPREYYIKVRQNLENFAFGLL